MRNNRGETVRRLRETEKVAPTSVRTFEITAAIMPRIGEILKNGSKKENCKKTKRDEKAFRKTRALIKVSRSPCRTTEDRQRLEKRKTNQSGGNAKEGITVLKHPLTRGATSKLKRCTRIQGKEKGINFWTLGASGSGITYNNKENGGHWAETSPGETSNCKGRQSRTIKQIEIEWPCSKRWTTSSRRDGEGWQVLELDRHMRTSTSARGMFRSREESANY